MSGIEDTSLWPIDKYFTVVLWSIEFMFNLIADSDSGIVNSWSSGWIVNSNSTPEVWENDFDKFTLNSPIFFSYFETQHRIQSSTDKLSCIIHIHMWHHVQFSVSACFQCKKMAEMNYCLLLMIIFVCKCKRKEVCRRLKPKICSDRRHLIISGAQGQSILIINDFISFLLFLSLSLSFFSPLYLLHSACRHTFSPPLFCKQTFYTQASSFSSFIFCNLYRYGVCDLLYVIEFLCGKLPTLLYYHAITTIFLQ